MSAAAENGSRTVKRGLRYKFSPLGASEPLRSVASAESLQSTGECPLRCPSLRACRGLSWHARMERGTARANCVRFCVRSSKTDDAMMGAVLAVPTYVDAPLWAPQSNRPRWTSRAFLMPPALAILGLWRAVQPRHRYCIRFTMRSTRSEECVGRFLSICARLNVLLAKPRAREGFDAPNFNSAVSIAMRQVLSLFVVALRWPRGLHTVARGVGVGLQRMVDMLMAELRELVAFHPAGPDLPSIMVSAHFHQPESAGCRGPALARQSLTWSMIHPALGLSAARPTPQHVRVLVRSTPVLAPAGGGGDAQDVPDAGFSGERPAPAAPL
jgi:hypothetical protein